MLPSVENILIRIYPRFASTTTTTYHVATQSERGGLASGQHFWIRAYLGGFPGSKTSNA